MPGQMMKLTKQDDNAKYERMIKILYDIAMDDECYPRDRITAAKRILDEGRMGEDAESRVGKLYDALKSQEV